MEPSPHILTDDDLEIRDMLARFPVTNGYQVVTAADRPVDGGWR
jgi:DNA-binding response OmpR family regulator